MTQKDVPELPFSSDTLWFLSLCKQGAESAKPCVQAVCFPGKQSMIAVRGVKWLLKGCSVIKFTT